MKSFAEKLANARSKIERGKAEDSAKQELESRERQRQIDEGIASLEEHVIPVLSAAGDDLARNGLGLRIKSDFDVLMYSGRPPSVLAVPHSAPRQGDGYMIETRGLIIEATNEEFRISITKEYSERPDKPVFEGGPDRIKEAIEEELLKIAESVLAEIAMSAGF